MTHPAKIELINAYRKEYRKAGKSRKSVILGFVTEATGYSRKHAIALLNNPIKGKTKGARPSRKSRYAHLYKPLRKLWAACNCACGKRLQPFLPPLLRSLKRFKEIKVSKQDEALLLNMSAATIDRMLAPARKGLNPKGRSTTKPGTLLKHTIPVRTFADWDDDRLGFLEVDLVAHCGESTSGEYVNTLDMTEVATGWTICAAFIGRSQNYCLEAFRKTTASLPFPLLGIDSDNDSVFLNAHFARYCKANQLIFTRSRAYKNNDQCRVEQKNGNVVRKIVGYGRFETPAQLDTLRRIYGILGLYQNYFQPSAKLISKERIGAKVKKKYDTPQTPCQRILARKDVPKETKKALRRVFYNLNPVELLASIQELVRELYKP
jgi:hypothetical protein